MFYVAFAALGLIVGSFLNAVIFRLEDGDSALRGRSRCRICRATIPWYYLVPVLSFFYLRRRCYSCGGKISFQYPLVEAGTALVFLGIASQIGPIGQISPMELIILAGFWFVIFGAFTVLFVYDLKHQLLPDKVLLPLIPLVLAADFLWGRDGACSSFCLPDFSSGLLAALVAGGFFLLLFLVSGGRWIGGGDVKLVAVLGLILGWPLMIVALFMAFTSGGIMGLALIAGGWKNMKSAIPFGPFLIGGAAMTLFFGQMLLEKSFYF